MPGIRDWFRNRNGNANGVPVAYVVVNLEPAAFWQPQTDSDMSTLNVNVCGNDYSATNTLSMRGLFTTPTPSNPNPRPLFVLINCVSNAPNYAYHQLLANAVYDGGGQTNFSAQVAGWRNLIDSVQAPPPRLTGARLSGGAFQFSFPGQAGRTNRVECSTNFVNWTILTNAFGANASILFRDTNALLNGRRFYRVVRP